MIESSDPKTIEEEDLRQVVIDLMNLVERVSSKVSEQAEAIQRLRDEGKRRKGEQGNPTFKPKKQALMLLLEKDCHEAKARHKAKKQFQLRIDRVEIVRVDEHHLPEDAQFKGYEDVIVQGSEFRTENITFRKEKYSSRSQKRTYLATLLVGFTGQFGPKVNAWILTLYYAELRRWDEPAEEDRSVADRWVPDQSGAPL